MKRFFTTLLLFATVIFTAISCGSENKSTSPDLLRYVDPYIGSGYHGHVFVGTSTPFGMVQLGPSNIHKGWDWCSAYHHSDSVLIGFAHTHLSGTGCTDLGDILVMPYTGDIKVARGEQEDISEGYASYYSHDNEKVAPNYYSLLIDRYNIKAELTTSPRVGFHRYTYPSNEEGRIIIDLQEGNGDSVTQSYIKLVDEYTVEGYRFSEGWTRHKVFFALRSNTPIKDFKVFEAITPIDGTELSGHEAKGVISYGDAGGEISIKVGISSVSCKNALQNIESEIADWDFDRVSKENANMWQKELAKIDVESKNEADKRTFYTAFYHTMIAPTLYCDYNGEYRGHDDKIYCSGDKPNYSTFSLWDTYRAAHPLMTIIQSEKVDDMVNAMLSIFDQQRKLPIWPLVGGETNQMPGYSAVPVISDAILKGFSGFDINRAYNALTKSATFSEQIAVPYVMEKGYIPCDKQHEATSIAMEYAVDDWGIAKVADKLDKAEDSKYYMDRALYYKRYFDSEIGFIRPVMDNGSWRTPYDPARSVHGVGDFCEGNGWQYTFFAPQDPYGLIALFGGDKPFTAKLDEFFVTDADMGEEASSDITGLIGQYAHGNEPSHHITYLYAYAGEQWKTAEKVRFIMDNFYPDTTDGIIGNEDCGQMSAWYMLSAMGFYQVNPASGIYVFGTPYMDKITLNLANSKRFVIEATNNSKENIYIQSVALNDKPYSKGYITYGDIMAGGTLKFNMGSTPNMEYAVNVEDRPIN